MIEEYCLNEVEENPTVETVEVVRLTLEFECEERRLEREEQQLEQEQAQRAREVVEAEAQKACHAEKALQAAQLAAAQKSWRFLRLAELSFQTRELR